MTVQLPQQQERKESVKPDPLKPYRWRICSRSVMTRTKPANANKSKKHIPMH